MGAISDYIIGLAEECDKQYPENTDLLAAIRDKLFEARTAPKDDVEFWFHLDALIEVLNMRGEEVMSAKLFERRAGLCK